MNVKNLAFTTALLTICFSDVVFADWSANFEAPSHASAEIRIHLPDDLDAGKLATLGVELNGIDITSYLDIEGNDFIYRPVEPFIAGQYTLRLVVLGDEIREKASWNFQIDGDEKSLLIPIRSVFLQQN